MKTSTITLSTISAILLFSGTAHAQQSVCQIMMKDGLVETRTNAVDDRAVNIVKNIVCSSSFDTYDKGKNAHMGGSFDLIGVLKGSPDDTVNINNYAEKRSKFCEMNTSDFIGSTYRTTSITTINTQLAKEFGNCVRETSQQTGGSYAYLQPSSDLTSFVVKAYKMVGYADIEEFSAYPMPTSCTGGLLKASKTNPVRVNGAKEFLCVNSDPNRVVTVVGNFAGDGNMFANDSSAREIPSRKNAIDLLSEKVAKLQKDIEQGGAKSGMVAFFTSRCPSPAWDDYKKLNGRYVVGVTSEGETEETVGKKLKDKENRAVGKHSHRYQRPNPRMATNANNESRYTTLRNVQNGNAKTLPEGAEDGTNAPYVQLKACIKR